MRKLLTSSVTSVSLLALSVALTPSAAFAQDTPPGTPESSTQDDDPTAAPAEDQDTDATAAESAAPLDTGSGENVIVVTGSRIARPEFSFPNPVQSFTSESIQQSGQTNLTDFLQNTPSLIASTDNQDVAGSALPAAQFVGVNLLNLRALGTQRTLVLVNGRRHIAGIFGTAQVDINTIPVDLIDRIDILTGGTSPVYGADGVSGVVNFVLKNDFEGLSVRAQSSISQRGDSGNRFITATWGKNFADGRGNIALAYEFNELDRFRQIQRLGYGRSGPTTAMIRNPGDRPDDCTPNSCPGGTGLPDQIPSDQHPSGSNDLRWLDSSPGGGIDLNLDYYPDFTGEGAPYDRGIPVRGTAFTIGGSSTSREIYFGDFTPYSRRHNFNAFGHFEFSPAARLFGEAKYVKAYSYTDSQPTFDFFTFLNPDNAFLNQRFGTQIADIEANCDPEDAPCFNGAYVTGRDHLDFGLRRYTTNRETYRGVLGLDGKISDNLKYELSLTYGQTNATGKNENDRITDRYFAALDAVVNPANGQITCRINLPGETEFFGFSGFVDYSGAPTTFQPGQCVPLNILGQGAPSQEALDWMLYDHTDDARLKQTVLSGFVSGDSGAFFNLPGGPVGFSLGAEYRKEKSRYVPDILSQQGALLDNSFLESASGKFSVKEAFGEVNFPIFRNAPLAHALEVGGSVRFSDYSHVGNTTAWSVNGVYAPVRDIVFRSTYSSFARAPNIAEMFGPLSGGFAFIVDPCGQDQIDAGTEFRVANCTAALTALGFTPAEIAAGDFDPANDFISPQNASIQGRFSGNNRLIEETAKTLTMGVVIRPRFINGLNVAFDWYDIKLRDAISAPTVTQLAALCYDQPTLQNVYCANLGRSTSTGYINNFLVQPENVASFDTEGLDFALNYRFAAPWRNGGMFNLKVTGNYLHKLQFIPTPGANVDDDRDEAAIGAGGPFPRYSATGDLTWTKGGFTVNYGINWFYKTRRYTIDQTAANPDIADPEYIWYKDYWEHQLQLSYDVEKRMNIYAGINNLWDEKPDVAVTGYPVSAVGRFFYLGVKVRPF